MTAGIVASIMLGLLIGLLANRWAEHVMKGSAIVGVAQCPKCSAKLGWKSLLPLAGGLLPCGACGSRRITGLAVEAIALFFTPLLFFYAREHLVQCSFLLLVGLVSFRTDAEERYLYDSVTLCTALGALLLHFPRIGLEASIKSLGLAIAVSLAILILCRFIAIIIGLERPKTLRDWLALQTAASGGGDPLLIGAICLWLSPGAVVFFLVGSHLLGVLWALISKGFIRFQLVAIGAFMGPFASLAFLLDVSGLWNRYLFWWLLKVTP
jgi:hypothetical protein